MDEKDLLALTVTVTENTQRSKSNSHQIEEIKDEIKEIRNEQKALYTIATSVEIIAKDMCTMKESINEVKQGQKELGHKLDEQITDVRDKIEKVDSKGKIDIVETNRDNIKQKITPFLIGGGSVGLIIYIIAEVIKLFGK